MFALTLFLCFAAVSANSLSRIINGDEATPGDHPHQVSLQFGGSHICGGAILNANWIVTAAHCTQNSPASRYQVVINEFDRNVVDENQQTIQAQRIINHESYGLGPGGYPNDISLIRLSSPISVPFKGIQLASVDDEVESTCTITGWGRNELNILPSKLQKTTGVLLTKNQCASTWGSNILDSHLCIDNANTGACNGDSGGPMECRRSDDGVIVLAGVTSWGASGCATSFPSVYTKISSFKSWIESNMY